MKRYGDILIIESASDLKPKDLIWEDEEAVRLNCGVIHHDGNKTFPQCYKYEESWDAHFCGNWYPISRMDAIREIREYMTYFLEKVAEFQETVLELQP